MRAVLMPLSSVSTASAMDTDRVTLASTKMHAWKSHRKATGARHECHMPSLSDANPTIRDRPTVFLPNAFAAEMAISVDALTVAVTSLSCRLLPHQYFNLIKDFLFLCEINGSLHASEHYEVDDHRSCSQNYSDLAIRVSNRLFNWININEKKI